MSVDVSAIIKPLGNFPVAEAADILMPDGSRLSEFAGAGSGGNDSDLENKVTEAVNAALEQAKASGEFDGADGQPGADGKDGVSPIVSVDQISGGHRVSINDAAGTKSFDVMDGKDGSGGGVSGPISWNDLIDQPFGEEVKSSTASFEQLPEEHFNAIGYTWWKISDLAPTKEQILETEVNLSIPDINHYVQWNPVETEFIVDMEALSGVQSGTYGIGLLFCREDGEHTAEVSGMTVSFVVPSVGVYFAYEQGTNPPSGLKISISYKGVKTLDAKYLPAEAVRDMVNEVISEALGGEY